MMMLENKGVKLSEEPCAVPHFSFIIVLFAPLHGQIRNAQGHVVSTATSHPHLHLPLCTSYTS